MLPLSRSRKINNVQSGLWPCPKLFQNCLLHFCQGSSWEPEWEMWSSCYDHSIATMSSHPPDTAPNFSKMALGMCLGAQVGNLSWLNKEMLRNAPTWATWAPKVDASYCPTEQCAELQLTPFAAHLMGIKRPKRDEQLQRKEILRTSRHGGSSVLRT